MAGAAKTFGDEALGDVRRLIAGLTGQAAEADRIISQAAGDLFAVTKKLYGTKGRATGVISGESPFAGVPDDVREAAQKFFSGDQAAIGDIPQEMRIHLARMRGQIDRFSKAFVDEGIVEGDLAIKFNEELGIYLTRSYRVFDDPDWLTNAPKVLGEEEWDGIVNDFKGWFREAYEHEGEELTDDALDVIYKDFLAHGDEGSNAMKYIQSGRLGKLNMKTLAGRKDIPVEVRRLWGEHEDPWVNYVRTLTNQGTFLANHRFLRELRTAGLKSSFLWDDAQGIRPKEMGDLTAQFTETKGPLGPLAGTRTTPEFKRALEEQFKNESIPTMFKVVLYPNSVSKIAKTVLSPVTHVRNLGANVMFTIANGHNPLVTGKNLKSSFDDVMVAAGWKKGTESQRDFVNRLVRLGVIDDNANAQELTRDGEGLPRQAPHGQAPPWRAEHLQRLRWRVPCGGRRLEDHRLQG
jgi:hypothetical protein